MKYSVNLYRIDDLIRVIKEKKINLRPSYQRNFIWGPKDQRSLISTIEKGWPLPNFFVYQDKEGLLEMVDGQQRAMTIYKFVNNEFKDESKKHFSDLDREKFLDYKLCFIILTDLRPSESLEQFYTLVNKRGIHLNPAEVTKAEYHDTPFMNLVKDVMEDQRLIDLDLFTDSVSKRMNDRALIEELLAYLFAGITDKRIEVERLFNTELKEQEIEEKKQQFGKILDKLSILNSIRPINSTRYKQRNDFYTFFCFINEHIEESLEILKEQYKILVFISDREDIRPTNEECEAFQTYAFNCVTQTNSKIAREKRLDFFNAVLCNKQRGDNKNDSLDSIESYYDEEFGIDEIPYKEVGDYYLIDVDKLR